jgi:hypothetical protein
MMKLRNVTCSSHDEAKKLLTLELNKNHSNVKMGLKIILSVISRSILTAED